MISVEFLAEAEDEFEAAAAFYETGSASTAARFVRTVNHTIALVQDFPELGSSVGAVDRRVLVSGFPYQVVYRFDGHLIIVVAIAHLHRKPDYWHGRL